MDTLTTSGDANGGSGVAARQAPDAEPASRPPKVIRGTSTPGNGTGPRTKVDYLTISCEEDGGAISECLAQVFRGAPAAPAFEHGPGMRHFEKSRRIVIAGVPAGVVLTGGATQRGRAC